MILEQGKIYHYPIRNGKRFVPFWRNFLNITKKDIERVRQGCIFETEKELMEWLHEHGHCMDTHRVATGPFEVVLGDKKISLVIIELKKEKK